MLYKTLRLLINIIFFTPFLTYFLGGDLRIWEKMLFRNFFNNACHKFDAWYRETVERFVNRVLCVKAAFRHHAASTGKVIESAVAPVVTNRP